MPGIDGTSPLGRGPMSGKGLGACTGAGLIRGGAGLGIGLLVEKRGFGNKFVRKGARLCLGLCRGMALSYRRGYGRNSKTDAYVLDPFVSKTQKELLEEQRVQLENRLDMVNKQLESL